MYEQRFGLKRRPFPASPDDAFYYPATGHEAALASLAKAIQAKEKQLSNDVFRGRAPEKVIKDMEGVLAEQKIELQKLQDRLSQLHS